MFYLDPLCLYCGLECDSVQKDEATTTIILFVFLISRTRILSFILSSV